MTNDDFAPIRPARLHWQDHTPVATEYDDPYFSRQDGRAESGHVFLDGNRLPVRFAALTDGDCFTIGETGFGTGLNTLLAARLFQERAPAGARLDLFSVEKHPLDADDLDRALTHWPDLGEPRRALREQYPAASPGYHRLWLADNVSLTLMLGEAEPLWRLCPATVDAWFLDGFAPSRNADMWQPALFRQLAAHSRPGATLATFTAAGAVRRGLVDAGFRVRRIEGFGHKRHMVVGEFGDDRWRPARLTRGTALVAGAGLAGATSARALAERGWQVTVLDPAGIAAGASGNRAGVVYSTPSPHLTAQNRFYQLSYGHALRWLRRHRFPAAGAGALTGVIQHYVDDKQGDKIRAAADSGVWPAGLLIAGDHEAELRGGGYLNPPAWCAALLDHPAIEMRHGTVVRLGAGAPASASLDDGTVLKADAIVIATAGAARALTVDGLAVADLAVHGRALHDLPLLLIRGQVSYCRATTASVGWDRARCHGGYLTPALDGLHCVGATFDPHDQDPTPRDADDVANLAQLRHYLPEHWRQLGGEAIEVTERRVGFRCQSTDFLPLAGPLPDLGPDPNVKGESLAALPGLWLNIAHGSRGLTGTPLCAEILADRISGAAPPADQPLLDALDPARFRQRQRRKKTPPPL